MALSTSTEEGTQEEQRDWLARGADRLSQDTEAEAQAAKVRADAEARKAAAAAKAPEATKPVAPAAAKAPEASKPAAAPTATPAAAPASTPSAAPASTPTTPAASTPTAAATPTAAPGLAESAPSSASGVAAPSSAAARLLARSRATAFTFGEGSIGLTLTGDKSRKVRIGSVDENSQAFQQGVAVGAELVAVNEKMIAGMAAKDVLQLLSTKERPLILHLIQPGNAPSPSMASPAASAPSAEAMAAIERYKASKAAVAAVTPTSSTDGRAPGSAPSEVVPGGSPDKVSLTAEPQLAARPGDAALTVDRLQKYKEAKAAAEGSSSASGFTADIPHADPSTLPAPPSHDGSERQDEPGGAPAPTVTMPEPVQPVAQAMPTTPVARFDPNTGLPLQEMRITFPSGAPLGVGLVQNPAGKVVVDSVQPTSAAAAVPIGATIASINDTSCEGKSMDDVVAMIGSAKSAGQVTATFLVEPEAPAMQATPSAMQATPSSSSKPSFKSVARSTSFGLKNPFGSKKKK